MWARSGSSGETGKGETRKVTQRHGNWVLFPRHWELRTALTQKVNGVLVCTAFQNTEFIIIVITILQMMMMTQVTNLPTVCQR